MADGFEAWLAGGLQETAEAAYWLKAGIVHLAKAGRAERAAEVFDRSLALLGKRADAKLLVVVTTDCAMLHRMGLDVSEMAKLMGHELSKADLRYTTSNQMRIMPGVSMHGATAGFALTGMLASVGVDPK